jgi:hypothetical protein
MEYYKGIQNNREEKLLIRKQNKWKKKSSAKDVERKS